MARLLRSPIGYEGRAELWNYVHDDDDLICILSKVQGRMLVDCARSRPIEQR
jgi:hypothetical protein